MMAGTQWPVLDAGHPGGDSMPGADPLDALPFFLL